MTIFDVATEDERAEAFDLFKVCQAAQEARDEHRRAKTEVEAQIVRLASQRGSDYRAAAQRYLGNAQEAAPETPAPSGPSRLELEEAGKGLGILLREDEIEIDRAQRTFLGRIVEITKACEDRIAPLFAQKAAELGLIHCAMLAGADFIRQAGGPVDLLNRDHFERLFIPGAPLPSIQDRGTMLNPTWGTRALAGGERVHVAATSAAAFRDLAATVTSLFGQWPLKGAPPEMGAAPQTLGPSPLRDYLAPGAAAARGA